MEPATIAACDHSTETIVSAMAQLRSLIERPDDHPADPALNRAMIFTNLNLVQAGITELASRRLDAVSIPPLERPPTDALGRVVRSAQADREFISGVNQDGDIPFGHDEEPRAELNICGKVEMTPEQEAELNATQLDRAAQFASDFIAMMKWTPDATETEYFLVEANVKTFARYLLSRLAAVQPDSTFKCRGCWKPLLPGNRMLADGCPCNSPRGLNHGLVPWNTCTCRICDPAETGSVRIGPPAAARDVTPGDPGDETDTDAERSANRARADRNELARLNRELDLARGQLLMIKRLAHEGADCTSRDSATLMINLIEVEAEAGLTL